MKARVHVTLKQSVLDPQGQAVHHAMARLGYDDVASVRQGKVFEIELADGEAAHTRIAEMCEKLLANTVIEDYSIDIGPPDQR